VQLCSLRHASTQEDGQTIRRKHAPAAGKRQIHARISRSDSERHALPCVYPLRTHFAHASPLAYCCPYACVVAQVETQPYCETVYRYRTWHAVMAAKLYTHLTLYKNACTLWARSEIFKGNPDYTRFLVYVPSEEHNPRGT
jgi:hypothetical protein